jgi:hypothetical protein
MVPNNRTNSIRHHKYHIFQDVQDEDQCAADMKEAAGIDAFSHRENKVALTTAMEENNTDSNKPTIKSCSHDIEHALELHTCALFEYINETDPHAQIPMIVDTYNAESLISTHHCGNNNVHMDKYRSSSTDKDLDFSNGKRDPSVRDPISAANTNSAPAQSGPLQNLEETRAHTNIHHAPKEHDAKTEDDDIDNGITMQQDQDTGSAANKNIRGTDIHHVDQALNLQHSEDDKDSSSTHHGTDTTDTRKQHLDLQGQEGDAKSVDMDIKVTNKQHVVYLCP